MTVVRPASAYPKPLWGSLGSVGTEGHSVCCVLECHERGDWGGLCMFHAGQRDAGQPLTPKTTPPAPPIWNFVQRPDLSGGTCAKLADDFTEVETEEEAKDFIEVCDHCPIKAACLDYAERTHAEDSYPVVGVWGGRLFTLALEDIETPAPQEMDMSVSPMKGVSWSKANQKWLVSIIRGRSRYSRLHEDLREANVDAANFYQSNPPTVLNPWTEEDDAIALSMSNRDAARVLGRSKSAVNKRCQRLRQKAEVTQRERGWA